ncbi:MAG: hypothetical protein WBW74_10240 [Xanthobacteraceae bacterium]
MKTRVPKLLAASAAIAALIAIQSAHAGPKHSAPRDAAGPSDVRSGYKTYGQDPDPFIQGEMMRHWHSGWPD